ncbi:MAG: tetratricopeptide repeat protein [bacterium]|nr:tetratricopeptide repeat protein [bacterium]
MKKTCGIYTVLLIVALLSATSVFADKATDAVSRGNEAFRNEEFKDALEQYQIAETEMPESPKLDYNIAGVHFSEGKYEDAVERYTRALNSTDMDIETSAYYNLGNTYYRMEDYQNAITSYQEALDNDPDFTEAKINLELARKMLKEQMKPQEQEEQEQQQQEQQEQEQEQEEKKEEEQQEQEEQQQQQNQQQDDQDKKDQEQQQQQSQPQEQKMSKEDAERILNALRDDERDIQKKIKRQVAVGDYTGKDW